MFDIDDLATAIFESVNYHGVSQIESALAKIKSKMDQYSYTPTVNDTARYVRNAYKASVGPKTIKGKNVSFMENSVNWHGAAPNDEQHAQAIAELKTRYI